MSCTTYIHNGPVGATKTISGTTCFGSIINTSLTYGQSVCMDDTKPIINLNDLEISGSCLPTTPTPTPTQPFSYCIFSARTYETAPYQCPNDGLMYEDIYGVIRLDIGVNNAYLSDNHPTLIFTFTNGTQYQQVEALPGQAFVEYSYVKKDFKYTSTGCVETNYPDWYLFTGFNATQCAFTPTPTPTMTPFPVCPEELYVSSGTTLYSGSTGLYKRTYTYAGGSFNYGFFTGNTGGLTFITGPDSLGNNAIVYEYYNSALNEYYQLIGGLNILTNTIQTYLLWKTNGGFLTMGYQPDLPPVPLDLTTLITTGGISYPQNGLCAFNGFYIAYPPLCPTATPTQTPTQTQTITPTVTPTNSPTPSITATNSPTPSITASQTNTRTPTQTPTKTTTPTKTPTQTPTPSKTATFYHYQVRFYAQPVPASGSCVVGSLSNLKTLTPKTVGLYYYTGGGSSPCNVYRIQGSVTPSSSHTLVNLQGGYNTCPVAYDNCNT